MYITYLYYQRDIVHIVNNKDNSCTYVCTYCRLLCATHFLRSRATAWKKRSCKDMKAALLQWKFTMTIRALLLQKRFKRFWKERSSLSSYRVFDLSLLYIYIMLKKAGNGLYPSFQTRARLFLSFFPSKNISNSRLKYAWISERLLVV